ncbi:Lysosomal alpha-glucosidase [Paramyrothecium foliicola]|nr:Lysosomal alpha-glucosidase [Paramyrothecium foliicola]
MRDYIRGVMAEATAQGDTVIRSLFYEFPYGANAWNVEHQYMFGSRFLVAPVLGLGQRRSNVYLPSGTEWKQLTASGTSFDREQGGRMFIPQGAASKKLNAALLQEVHYFWFRHIYDKDHLVVPSSQDPEIWFTQNNYYDQECVRRFEHALRNLSAARATVDDVLAAAEPRSAIEWMDLIIFLDQIPRNCYRDELSGVAYRFFDPLALEIARRAIDAKLPEDPSVKWKQTYRFWFYLPLEHSENLEILQGAKKEYDRMFNDSRQLLSNGALLAEAEALKYREVLFKRRAELDTWEHTLRTMLANHVEIIKEHGRYPRRDVGLAHYDTK